MLFIDFFDEKEICLVVLVIGIDNCNDFVVVVRSGSLFSIVCSGNK